MKYHYLRMLVLLVGLGSSNLYAQDAPPPDDSNARARIDAARAAYITERLDLTTEEAEKFWPIYNEFAEKRQALRKAYKNAKTNDGDEEALVELSLKLKQQELDLEKEYSGRLMSAISAQKLMRLRNAEKDFTQLILRQIQQRNMQQEKRQQMRERQQMRLQQRNN